MARPGGWSCGLPSMALQSTPLREKDRAALKFDLGGPTCTTTFSPAPTNQEHLVFCLYVLLFTCWYS